MVASGEHREVFASFRTTITTLKEMPSPSARIPWVEALNFTKSRPGKGTEYPRLDSVFQQQCLVYAQTGHSASAAKYEAQNVIAAIRKSSPISSTWSILGQPSVMRLADLAGAEKTIVIVLWRDYTNRTWAIHAPRGQYGARWRPGHQKQCELIDWNWAIESVDLGWPSLNNHQSLFLACPVSRGWL
jgi:hypothetical protein